MQDVGDWTQLMGAIAATCAAITGVFGIGLGVSVWWKNRGRGALKGWIHETSGAGPLRRELMVTNQTLEKVVNSAAEDRQLRDRQHSENLEAHKRIDTDMGALVGAQDQLATTLRTLSDELTAASEERALQMRSLTVIAQEAAEGARHARSRKKHPGSPRPSTA